jgi:predicted Zn finger-like uncharacterized protein
MHIQCPSCQTVFAVENDEISADKGRQVRCSICDHIWTVTRADALAGKSVAASGLKHSKRKLLIILAITAGLLLGGAVIWRNIVSAMFPSVIGIYSALDLSVMPDVSVVEIRNIRGERQGDTVRIRGEVVNTSMWPTHAPPIFVSVQNMAGAILAVKEVEPDAPIISAGSALPLNVQLTLDEELRADVETEIVAIAVNRMPKSYQGKPE